METEQPARTQFPAGRSGCPPAYWQPQPNHRPMSPPGGHGRPAIPHPFQASSKRFRRQSDRTIDPLHRRRFHRQTPHRPARRGRRPITTARRLESHGPAASHCTPRYPSSQYAMPTATVPSADIPAGVSEPYEPLGESNRTKPALQVPTNGVPIRIRPRQQCSPSQAPAD